MVLADSMGTALPNLTSREAANVVNSIIEVLRDTLAGGQDVKIAGFGKFYLKDKDARMGRNPQTGEAIKISARRVLGFKVSDSLKQSINGAL
jgi:integration host factor subunit alpha